MPLGKKREGIVCPYCECRMNSVTKTTQTDYRWSGKQYTRIKRTRLCRHCGLSFNTVESYESETSPGSPSDAPPIPPKENPTRLPRNPFT